MILQLFQVKRYQHWPHGARGFTLELGQIVAGLKPGRERDDETNLFWHRGLSLSDIALGAAMLEKAKRLGIGQMLLYR